MSGQRAEPEPEGVLDEPPAHGPTFMRRLKWIIIMALAAVEFGFDLWVEPWLRLYTGWEESIERFMAAVEVLALGSVIWMVFTQLERLEERLELRRREVVRLYRAAAQWDRQLEALHEASVAMTREDSYPVVLERIVRLAAELVQARYGALAEFDENENVVEFLTYGVPEAVRDEVARLPTHRGLLRKLSGRKPVRLEDVTADPAFTGFPQGHPSFRTFLGVPIRWEGELLGHLYLGGHEGEVPFSAEEERLLEMFALQAAVVISRARLTREYARAVRQSERRQVAMELHDRALQSLYALGIQLDRARRRGLERLTDTMSVDLAMQAIERSMQAIRDVLITLDKGEPSTVLEALTEPAQAAAGLYGVSLTWRGLELAELLSEDVAEDVGLCVAEAVSNAARHGGAGAVTVELARTEGALVLNVEDDGRGLPATGVVPGHGLTHMRRRFERLAGEFRLEAGTKGARLFCRLPLPDPAAAEGQG